VATGWSVRRAILGVDLDVGNRSLQGAFGAQAPARRGIRRRKCGGDRGWIGRSGHHAGEEGQECVDPKVSRGSFGAAPGDSRSLVYYHDKSVEEVAQIVGIPENTVKTRMLYARKRLAELLKAAGIERGWP
jgi:hypothetical protein